MTNIVTDKLDYYINKLLPLVNLANSAVMEIYNSPEAIKVDEKQDNSPVTNADYESHSIIAKGLKKLFPDIPLVSEEARDEINQKGLESELFWLIDPIDGTKEFINRNGQFTICIALIYLGKPILGLVSAPALDEIYYGGAGFGSFVKKGTSDIEQLHVATSPTGIIFVSKSHTSEPTNDYIMQYYPKAILQDFGSQLKFVKVAAGLGDAHPRLGTTMRIWDVAAGHAIVEGAGGVVKRPDGSLIDYTVKDFFVGDFVASAR